MDYYAMQKETTGYSVWSVSEYTGSKKDCLELCNTKKEAKAVIRKLEKKA